MNILTISSTVALMLIVHTAYGHGENKLGPNGGFIKMPGAFHTEVVPVGQNKLKVFLLDMNWKNPSILNSNLSVTHKASGTTTATCQRRAHNRFAHGGWRPLRIHA